MAEYNWWDDRTVEDNYDDRDMREMKIKDLLKLSAFQGADFVDYETHETIIDQEKEIEDVRSIQLNEKVEHLGTEYKYAALHRWLTIYVTTKEKESLDALKELRDYYEEGTK